MEWRRIGGEVLTTCGVNVQWIGMVSNIKLNSKCPLAESQWVEIGEKFMEGMTYKDLAIEYGVVVSSIQYRSKIHMWGERKRCLRLGIPFNPDGNQAVPVSHTGGNQVDEFDEARTLRGRHGKLYYRDLDRLREQIEHVDSLIMGCSDSMQMEQLSKTCDRMRERYRIIQGISGPALLKGERERKVKSAPILPLDG